uniref:A18-like helicase n=1 Tax=Marseillevirus LCMAC201 TaxID=2506605 RepID=A0A481YX22_9VIRU|nr:MAG: A18-like helicase [Marseillevirus LCMAC201]
MSLRIDKTFINDRDINQIKNDCYVEGKENDYGPPDSLRAYGETPSSLYIPFAYAKTRFKKSPNKDIQFPQTRYTFKSEQFPFRTDCGRDQQVVFNEATQLIRKHRSALLSLYCNFGKCLAKDTPILMYDGTIKMVQNVQVGDLLMGDDSTPRNVLSLARGREEMYEIVPNKGDSYTVNKSHILSLKISGNRNIIKCSKNGKLHSWLVRWFDHEHLKIRGEQFYHHHNSDVDTYITAQNFRDSIVSPDVVDISVEDYINLPAYFHGPAGALLGYKVGVDFPAQPVDIDPYMLGYWLGDGVASVPSTLAASPRSAKLFERAAEPLVPKPASGSKPASSAPRIDPPARSPAGAQPRITKTLKPLNLYLNPNKHDPITYSIRGSGRVHSNSFLNALKSYNLVSNKHIPQVYKSNSREVRLQLLAGLLDSDGSLQCNCFDFVQKSKVLAEDTLFLVRSLGLAAYIKKCRKTCTNDPGGPPAEGRDPSEARPNTGTYYRMTIFGHTDMIPTILKRKQATCRQQIRDPLATRIKVVPKGIGHYYGFSIDGNHRFLLGDFTVTHNTYLAIRLAQASGVKAAILAHRGILFDQWAESIQKFTTATVQQVDTDGILDPTADFYIFNIAFVHKRWQKSTKSWIPKKLGIYKDIGILIVDEAHIACASEMSRALLYFNPRITLALTATPVRKDGMDKALELYFGKYDTTRIIRIATDPFVVYRLPTGIKPEFTYNAFGKKDWNSVISSLVENKIRNKLIIRLICKFDTYNILLLTKRKSHCKLLSTQLTKLGISNTVMTGTTKKYDKTARVLLSTYSKLGVGFDDTRLNMLIVACSVTEVEQYAGRLRDGVDKKRIIIDLVDDDPNCLKHWCFRRVWYISRKGNVKHYYRVFPNEKPKAIAAVPTKRP